MKKRKNGAFWCALAVFSLMGQIAWVVENMYFNVFIYKMFHASAADISLMVAASAVTATLTTVLIGALSDKIGKRKLFICGGYILWGVSIFSFVFLREDVISKTLGQTVSAATVGVSLAIILDCVMTFFGSSANDAAFNAWLTDSADPKKRGAAEGINAMMPLVAILVVFGGFMFFDLEKAQSWQWIFTIIGVLVLFVGILGFFIIKEPHIKPSKEGYFQSVFYGFLPSTVKKHPKLYLALAAFVIFNISIQIFMPYLIIYYEVSLGMKDYVLIMAPAILIASAVTAVWGKVYDKKGFTFAGLVSCLSLAVGYVVLYTTKTTLPVFIGSLLMMSGYLAGMAVFGAVIRDYTPKGKAGRLQGIRIFSQVLIPGVIGPFIGKSVLENAEVIIGSDGTASFVPNENIFLAALVAILPVLPFFLCIRGGKKPQTVDLVTPFETTLSSETPPFSQYPRPQMKRDSFLNLNGKWDFSILRKGKTVFSGKILVPFAPESRLSGVQREIHKKDVLVYETRFTLTDAFLKDRVLLHFGAVDQYTSVFVGGRKVATHEGGYLPFTIDITDAITIGENTLRVEARDPLCKALPYGKQTNRRGGMWYTKVSGIWQTVWLESVPKTYIEGIKITPSLSGVDITVVGGETEKTVAFSGKEYDFAGDTFHLEVEDPILWSPENPHLYEVSLLSGEDKISSYFALRTITIEENNGTALLCLNGKPYYFHGLLDQGYFSDGIFLPASEEGFVQDIMSAKECGYNMLRKHIKVEPDIFYYYCDKYGMAVFQDMVNSGNYSFFVDTALPTVFLRRGITHFVSKRRKAAFEETSEGIIDTLYNHPSVVYYTIFNEGWGQFDAKGQYQKYKAKDSTRIYDTTSGWFKTTATDVESDHVYFKKIDLKPIKNRPMVLSEFGGYCYKVPRHSFNPDETYGYRHFKTAETLEKGLDELYNEVIRMIDRGLCATVLTQLSDVEDEANGLMTYDRQVLKVHPEEMQKIREKLQSEFDRRFL